MKPSAGSGRGLPQASRVSRAWLLPSAGWLGFFLGLPMVLMAVTAFARRGPYGAIVWEWGGGNFARLFDPLYLGVILESVRLAALTTLGCFALGYPLAYWMVTARERLRPWLLLAVLIPFWACFVVRVYSVKHFFAYFPEEWGLFPSETAVLFGMLTGYLPTFVLPVFATLGRFDFTLLEAARDLGARGPRVFFRVLLPGTLPGWLTGALFVFTASLGEFVIPNLLGGARTALIGGVIADQFLKARDWPFGSALGLFLLLVSLMSLFALLRYGDEASPTLSSGAQGARPRARFEVRAIAALALFVLLLPLGLLVAGSFRDPSGGLTLDWYARALADSGLRSALGLSLVLACGSALIAVLLGTSAAFALARAPLRFPRLAQGALFAPIVVPELVLGIGALAAFSRMGWELGPLATLCVHGAFGAVYVVLTVRARLLLLSPELDEAAADLGAGPRSRFLRVSFPLALPAILSGAALAFSLSFDDFLISFFTLGVSGETLPVRIYSMIRYGISPEVNAISTLLVSLTAFVAWGILRAQRLSRIARREISSGS